MARMPRYVAATLALTVALGTVRAVAQDRVLDLDAQHLHPSPFGGAGIAIDGGAVLPAWSFSAALFFNHGERLITAETETGSQQVVLLQRQTVIEPAFAFAFPFGLSLDLAWPFPVHAAGNPGDLPSLPGETIEGSGHGDPRLRLAWRIAPADVITLLLSGTFTVPAGGAEFAAEPGLTMRWLAGVDFRVDPVTLRLNMFYRNRTTDDGRIGPAFAVGDEFGGGLGVDVAIGGYVGALAEVQAASAIDDFGGETLSPAEALFGVRVLPVRDFEILAFGGFGLTRGYGTPAYRAGLGLRFYPHLHDGDGDEVDDEDDRCPGELEDRDGFQDDDGCPDPDNDGDGVPDAADRCPEEAGVGRHEGCPDPDRDHDGLVDTDRCPDEAEDHDGFEDDDGCPDPDNDNDTFPDGEDRCPNDAEDRDGFEDTDGCPEPDNDRDGIPDGADRCPREPEDQDGFEDDDGCADTDNDGDGIPDVDDGPPDPGGLYGVCRSLPETPGGRDEAAPDGCPDSAVHVDVAARRIRVPPVFFDTNADVIQQRSYADLEYVAEVILANPWIGRVMIEGHTDDRGTDEHNLDLSLRRAKSVVSFLIEAGVEQTRLDFQGFGRSRPPTEQDVPACRRPRSAECRQAARRVVFVIQQVAQTTPESAPGATPAPVPGPPTPAP